MRSIMILATLLVFGLSNTAAWDISNNPIKITTPLGITVTLSQTAKIQYEATWSQRIEDIDWDRIDDFFSQLNLAYGTVRKADPKQIKITIMPWHPGCVDAEDPGTKEFHYRGMCIDGAYPGVVLIHLGDDPGSGTNAWCRTALDYEIGHYFLKLQKDLCWYYEFSSGCASHYIFGNQVGLCQ